MELPLAEWGSAGVPFLFIYFHVFAASSTIPRDNFISLQDSQATFGTNFKKNIVFKPCTWHCSSGITILELPLAAWSSPALP